MTTIFVLLVGLGNSYTLPAASGAKYHTRHFLLIFYTKCVWFLWDVNGAKPVTYPPPLCTVVSNSKILYPGPKERQYFQVTDSSFHNLPTWKNTILITEIKEMLWQQRKNLFYAVLHCFSEGRIYDIYLTILVALMYTLSFKWQFPSWGITIPANLLSRARWEVWSVITRSSRFASLRHPIWL